MKKWYQKYTDNKPEESKDGPLAEGAQAANPDPRSLLDSVISKVVHAAGSEAGLVALFEENDGKPFYTASYGLGEGEARNLATTLMQNLPELQHCPWQGDKQGKQTGEAGEQASNTPLALTFSPAEAVSAITQHKGEDLHLVAIPLRTTDGMVGLLCLLEPKKGENESDIFERPGLYNIIVKQVDIVAQNARLFYRLLNEKRWLEEVLQQTSEAILVVDPQRRIIGLNRALERLTGWHGPESWGKDAEVLFDFHHTDEATPEHYNDSNLPVPLGHTIGDHWLAACIDAGVLDPHHATQPAEELTIRNSDGTRLAVEASCGIIRDPDGCVLGATVTLHDITARKEAEMMQATFLSVVSHELQTPIAIIKGYAGLLGDTIGQGNTTARQQLSIVYEESERLSKMVEDLLTVTRLQAGKLDFSREPVDPGSLLERVAQKLQALLTDYPDRHIVVADLPDLPAVRGDSTRLEQVLTNLVENALKYGAGTITLAAQLERQNVRFSVSDEGQGVPAEEAERIFTPFTRLDSRMVRERKGVGLGLFIARSIINTLGGEIGVQQAASGGAEFYFTLPVEHEEK